MSDMLSERLLTVSEAASVLARRPHVAVLWRWMQRGCGGVKLESVQIRDVRYTSREALERFARRVSAARRGDRARVSSAAHPRSG